MADVPYFDRPHDEISVHEATFQRFVQLLYVGALHVANVIVALAVGGVQHQWGTAVLIMLLATAVAVYSLIRNDKAPMAILSLVSLLALLFHV